MTKEHTIQRYYDGSQLQQRAPLDSKELSSYRRSHSSFVQTHRRQRNMTWNRTRSIFWRLAVALSMIAVAAGHSERTPINLDLEEDFFYAVESSDQSFGDSYHPEKNRSLQFDPIIVPDPILIPAPITIPTLPPFSFPPIPPIVILFVPTNRPTPQPTLRPTRAPTPLPVSKQSKTGQSTNAPVAATFRPTPSPVAAPTPRPTRRPTRRPSREPTPEPTPRPTRRPIHQPTPEPSPRPTRPTRRPSGEPTDQPTRTPTDRPSIAESRRPTRSPTTEPTQPSSPRPTRRPTRRPSRGPTESPTRRPTSPPITTNSPPSSRLTETPSRLPTRRPSRQPTRRPSPRPTRSTTNRPTRSPTRRPTRSPERSPTDRPTRNPTDRPTRNPTDRPTRNPTNRPTRAPTRSPTRAPTNTPTARPTFRPSRPPNFDPTISPSLRPTARPSLRPTPNPTRRPTLSPTPIPTVSPTLFPTPIASAAPSSMPSPSPSLRPSATSSSSPTESPSELPSSSPSTAPSVSFQPSISSEPSLAPTPDFEFSLITLEAYRVIMEFSVQGDGRRLQEDLASSNATEEECIAIWVNYVTKSMESEVQQVIPRYETLNVQIYNVSRDTFEDLEVLAFFYDVRIDIRSAIIVHNLRRYIGGPFDSSIERDALVAAMRASSCPGYSNLRSVRVILPDETKATTSGSVDNPTNSVVIAGSVVFVAAAAMLVAVFIFVRIKRKRDVLEEIIFDTSSQSEGKSGEHEHDNEMASEIGVQTDVEVSTLGDPIPQGTFPSTGISEVSTAGSFSLDYDYKAYCKEVPSITAEASRSGGGGDSLTNTLVPADDDTFEAQYGAGEPFEVLAPPGILGLILETNEDGVPTIHNIRPASVLAEQVQIGDRLLSVDGIDVSTMLASDVSRLIASRKDAPNRKFVFTRPMMGAGSFDQDVIQ